MHYINQLFTYILAYLFVNVTIRLASTLVQQVLLTVAVVSALASTLVQQVLLTVAVVSALASTNLWDVLVGMCHWLCFSFSTRMEFFSFSTRMEFVNSDVTPTDRWMKTTPLNTPHPRNCMPDHTSNWTIFPVGSGCGWPSCSFQERHSLIDQAHSGWEWTRLLIVSALPGTSFIQFIYKQLLADQKMIRTNLSHGNIGFMWSTYINNDGNWRQTE